MVVSSFGIAFTSVCSPRLRALRDSHRRCHETAIVFYKSTQRGNPEGVCHRREKSLEASAAGLLGGMEALNPARHHARLLRQVLVKVLTQVLTKVKEVLAASCERCGAGDGRVHQDGQVGAILGEARVGRRRTAGLARP